MPTKTELKKREAISLFLTGKTDEEVAEAVGVSRQTIWRWKKEEDFNHDIVEAGEGILAAHTSAVAELVDEAIGVMSDLLKSEDDSIKFKAATTVLNSAKNWQADRPEAPGHTRAEHEMFEEQMEALKYIERQREIFEKQGGKPEDFTRWSLIGRHQQNGNAAESIESTESKETETSKSEKTPAD